MKKKICVLLLILALLVSTLAGCGQIADLIFGPVVEPSRGTWDDHVYTSEYLGLRFVMPLSWTASTDFEIAILAGMAANVLETAGSEMPSDLDELTDMMATSLTGANVQVRYTRIGRRVPPTEEMLEAVVEEIERVGGRVNLDSRGTARIGAYVWESFDTEIDAFGITMYGRQFFTIQEGFLRNIVITTTAISESFEDILSMFISIDDPVPPAPVAERPEALIGTWAWDLDSSFSYVFYADGQGTRGFPNQTESFEWFTEGDNHLVLLAPASEESWTFAIQDGVLSIDSRQAPGVSFSYTQRGEAGQAQELVGTWVWDSDMSYVYVFYADGFGTRGFPNREADFEWRTEDGDHLLIATGLMEESWTFVIEDGVLTIDSRQAPGVTFSYILQ